jgi:uncharacterized protein
LSFYLDTSVMVAALTPEAHSPMVQEWLGRRGWDRCIISPWVMTEFSSALSIKLRTRQLTISDRAAALTMLHRLIDDAIATVPVEASAFRLAAHFADQHALGVRSGDALHLAVCAEAGFTLCTLDRQLAQAAPTLGVAAELVGASS